MVSALWNACSEGDLNAVVGILESASPADIEIKDPAGITPLIQAVKNGHVEIVKALLAKGADSNNSSSQGRPVDHTSDPAIQELLGSASQSNATYAPPPPEGGYQPEFDPSHGYYGPPPGAYYYPPPPHLPEGAVPYYPPPPGPHMSGEQPFGHLPPPDIARMIPCRYFPACRYGASCMFAHPGQYMPGPMPPAQYPVPFDPMSPYPPQGYYGESPPSFQSPNGAMNPMSPHSGPIPNPPHPPHMHTRHSSEMVSPVVTHFSPQGPGPVPFNSAPMSPTAYPPHSTQIPVMSPLPPLQHPVPPHPQQGPHQMYPPPHGHMSQYPMPREAPYPQIPPEQNGVQKSPVLHPRDGFHNGHIPREGMGFRRGGMRKPSFGRKPPCLFFPSGRCKNGNDCRFPHVLPDANGSFGPNRPGAKPRYPLNGLTNLENNMAQMNLQDDENGQNTYPSTQSSSRSHSIDARQGFRANGALNGAAKKKASQRVPTSDEFPTLGGTTTPPRLTNGSAGPTAAQVLQAPPPARKDSGKDFRDVTLEQVAEPAKVIEVNGKGARGPDPSAFGGIPLSFAAAANAGKELTVSA